MPSSYRDRINSLSRFLGGAFSTTSFFLDNDKTRRTPKEISLAVKHLLAEARARVSAMDAAKEKKGSLEKDLAALEAYCGRTVISDMPGLAIFSSSGAGLWELFELPKPPRDRLVFDHNPYIRPISMILDQYHRYMVLVIDRREARWYETFMGRIAPLSSLSSEVPKKVKSGLVGPEAKRVERHVDAAVHAHYKKAAQTTFDMLKKNGFAGVLLGGADGIHGDFETHLHPYVRDRIKGRLKAKPADPLDKVLRESIDLEQRINREEEDALLKKLVGEIEKGRRARSGLRDCLESLNKSEVQTLVVTREFAAPGKSCPRCRLLYQDELRCPSCERKTEARPDIVDEAIESAFHRNCEVKYVTAPSRLDHYGKIGAFLRY